MEDIGYDYKLKITEHYSNSHRFISSCDTDKMLCFEELIDILISDIKIDSVNGIDKAKETGLQRQAVFQAGLPETLIYQGF